MTEASAPVASLHEKIQSRTAVVGIVGLGYVGLPLALTFAEKGFSVLGFDVDATKVEALNDGRNYIQHLDGSRLIARPVRQALPGHRRLPAAGRAGRR